MIAVDYNKEILFVATHSSLTVHEAADAFHYLAKAGYDYSHKGIVKDRYTPSLMAMRKKPCTHQHAFRGTCLTCGEEDV